MNEKVKVQKGTVVKTIQKKDLPQYVAMGWKEVNSFEFKPRQKTYDKIL